MLIRLVYLFMVRVSGCLVLRARDDATKDAEIPFGPILLLAAALGLVVFGVYGLCEARWRRV